MSWGKVTIKSYLFRIYFCLKSRNETSLVTSMGLCRAEEENLNQRKKKSLMKALKMSIIHCSLFIISWTPYTFMATWWEEKTKNLSLEDTHTRNLYKVFFQISLHRDMTCNFIVNKQSKQDEKVSSQSSLSGNSLIKAFMVSFP